MVLLLTVLVGHRFDLVETPAFLWVLGIVALLAALALLFAGFAFSRLWNFGDRGGRDLTVGALLALLVLAPYGVAAYWATTYPPLRDISTDFDNPPALDATRPDQGHERAVAAHSRRAAPADRSLSAGHRTQLQSAVRHRRGCRRNRARPARLGPCRTAIPTTDGQSEVTIDAVAKGFVLGLPADVAIRVTDDGDAIIVDMRSASRYGRYDLGDNAARIVDFLAELDQEVARARWARRRPNKHRH